MASSKDGNLIPLKAGKIPEQFCCKTPGEFVRRIAGLLFYELPRSLSSVIKGFATPGPDDIDKLWVKTTRDNKPLGHCHYINGAWRPVHYLPPTGAILIKGTPTSNPPPEDFQAKGEITIEGETYYVAEYFGY